MLCSVSPSRLALSDAFQTALRHRRGGVSRWWHRHDDSNRSGDTCRFIGVYYFITDN